MSSPTTLVADRYRLVKLIGSGGMGVVWHAWDERLHRAVALKMLRTEPDLSDREREIATDRAMREARITAGLHHPHAVAVFDVVEHEGRPCIVMQLIESTPLSVLLRERGTLTPREAARIGAQAGSALAAAHKMRIVHRDVKPGNILITEDGSAMISDFGISHALGDTTITATGMVHGTPAYLAPEVAQGKPSSFASDVFSLGASMYAMLEGAPPFGADDNALALLHRVARGDFPPPQHAGALDPLLRTMLAADPRRRPSMKTVAARLSAMHERTEGAEGTEGAEASELPTVPVAAPAAAEADAADATAVAEVTLQAGRTAETERLDEAPGSASPTAPTERLGAEAASPSLAWLTQRPPEQQQVPPSVAPPPSVAAPPSAETPPTDAAPPRRGRTGVLVGVLVILGILIAGGAVLFGALRPDAGDLGAAPDPSATPTAPETSASGTPTPEAQPTPVVPAPTPPPEETAAAPPPPSAEQRVVDAITTYYALVPGDLDTAWTMMTADYQENHVGGRGAYDAFWGDVAGLEVTEVTATAPDQGQATLTYSFTDGSVVQEVTAFRLVEEPSGLKIAATEVLSSVWL